MPRALDDDIGSVPARQLGDGSFCVLFLRHDGPVRPQPQRQLEPLAVPPATEHHHPSPLGQGHLQAEQADAARPDHGDEVSCRHPGQLGDGVHGAGQGLAQGGGAEADVSRQLPDASLRDDALGSERAVVPVPHRLAAQAEVDRAAAAVAAFPADAHARQRGYAHPRGDRLHPFSDGGHHAAELVPDDDGHADGDGNLVPVHVQVGAADSRGLDLDEHFPRPGDRFCHLANLHVSRSARVFDEPFHAL